MKDILTTGLGMFIFGDVKFVPKNVVGVSVGLTGGLLYAYFSYRDSQQRAAVSAPLLRQHVAAISMCLSQHLTRMVLGCSLAHCFSPEHPLHRAAQACQLLKRCVTICRRCTQLYPAGHQQMSRL